MLTPIWLAARPARLPPYRPLRRSSTSLHIRGDLRNGHTPCAQHGSPIIRMGRIAMSLPFRAAVKLAQTRDSFSTGTTMVSPVAHADLDLAIGQRTTHDEDRRARRPARSP